MSKLRTHSHARKAKVGMEAIIGCKMLKETTADGTEPLIEVTH